MMLILNADQRDRLQAIQRARDLARLGRALAESFPDVPERLGERYPRLIEHGAQQAARHGLQHGAAVARYLACWFALGAEFESKPGFEWALQLLSAVPRTEGAKAYQLARRTLEELQRLAAQPGGATVMPTARLAEALPRIDAVLQRAGALGSLHVPQVLALGAACDIDALDLRPKAPTAAQVYQLLQGQWQRAPWPAGPVSWTTTAEQLASQPAPVQLNLLTNPDAPDATRLRLRTRAAACCDPELHPLVRHNSRLGCREWRGPLAADLMLDLLAPVQGAEPGTAPPAVQPVMAAETGVELSVLSLSSCGLRDSGPPLGDCSTRLAVYSGEQRLIAWRREPSASLHWPAQSPSPALANATPLIRAERDGVAMDASAWQAGLAELDRQLIAGLDRLANAWERDSGVTQAQVQAEPRVMCGTAGLTWGWAASASGWAQPPFMRVAGMFDMTACQLQLRLTGELRLHGSITRLALECHDLHPLRAVFERTNDPAGKGSELQSLLAAARCQASQAFTLTAQQIAVDTGTLLELVAPPVGGLQIDCGLRQRPQGHGLQWYARISLQPVAVRLCVHDPLLGIRRLLHPLLPALNLLDWSLG